MDRQEQKCNVLFFKIKHITDTMAPIDVTPVLGMFGGTISDSSQVRSPTGTVDFLIGINCASLFPVFTGDDTHREENLRLLTSKFRTWWLLDGTHPSLKPGAMMRSRETPVRAHAAWTTKWFVETGRSSMPSGRQRLSFLLSERSQLRRSRRTQIRSRTT